MIARQLAMNAHTLAALRRAGLKPDAVVQLDFMFIAPDHVAAQLLKSHLEGNDCLDVAVAERSELGARGATVTGKSQPTMLSADILARWVPWMVVQGILYNCEFDGWGTEVPA